jgi:hypothetical protein
MKQAIFDSMFGKFLLLAATLISPIAGSMYIVGFLVFVNTFFAVWTKVKEDESFEAYRSNHGFFRIAFKFVRLFWFHIETQKLNKSLSKLVVFNVGVILAFLINIYIVPESEIPLVKLMLSAIAIKEGKSIDENAQKLTGFSFWNTIKKAFPGQ